MDQAHIRNFSIIAHIDHGKSTLADRILQITGAVSERDMREQVLDSMDLERERGITIKAQAVRVEYTADDGETYQINLIDTPGHVDFSYEVSRSLAACEGALLVVDASQGIEAQTLANAYLAIEGNLEVVPVLNKIDLPAADPDLHARALADLIGDDPERVLRISAKTGLGVKDVLEAIVIRMPPPQGDPDAAVRALIFDSVYDQYRGVVAFIRVMDGEIRTGSRLRAMATGRDFDADEIGVMSPVMTPVRHLGAGETGYIVTGLKSLVDLRVGDTLTLTAAPAAEALPGYREVKPVVFCGLFPVESDDYPDLRDALDKLSLNDASLVWEPETSQALGFGFRCGFLGLLHMDIIRERLEREYDLALITTTPTVEYAVTTISGSVVSVRSPADLPNPSQIEQIEEPFVRCTILVPRDHVGAVMGLCQERRGSFVTMTPIENRQQVVYDMPLAEIVLDFYDQLKSRTRGYASLDYEIVEGRIGQLVKLDILLAGEPVDALSMIVHRDSAYSRGKGLVERLKETIPRQMFDVPVQAAIGGKVIARETVKAKRKDVLAKCYGGDISRKRKLLEKQKEGKKRMKHVGNVEVPQEAFLAILQLDGSSTP
ncbi:MAG: elongation factor 4 [Thermoleophilia bacterium]|nr:elongation factor 4 [Thermoleophilia bacterium]